MSKASLRDCPAQDRAITSRECGENRGINWACPAECPHFPFTLANYDKWLEIEREVINAVLCRALDEMPPELRTPFVQQLADRANMLRGQSLCAWAFFHERDAAGRTFVARWEADGWRGLKNDQLYLLSLHRRMRPGLLEVRCVLDEQRIEVVDLLGDPARVFRIIDRRMAASIGRFSTVLTWFYETPHGARMSGGGMAIHQQGEIAPAEVLAELLRHLGAPDDSAARRGWLVEHLARVADAYSAVLAARWEDTTRHIDTRYTKTDYRMRGRSLAKRLDRHGDLLPEPPTADEQDEGFADGWVWLEHEASAGAGAQLTLPLASSTPRVGAGRPVLGRVLLADGRARIEASSSARHAALRACFEKLAGPDVEFIGERVEDLGRQLMNRHPRDYDPALIPPRLLENPQRLHVGASRVSAEDLPVKPGEPLSAAVLRRQYERFADEPLPALDGHTPRAASRDPALRPRLLRLMQSHVRSTDEHAVRDGFVFDLNPLLADLGLDEIILPPPPPRDPLPDETGADDWDAGGTLEDFDTAPRKMPEDDSAERLAAVDALPDLAPILERMDREAGAFMRAVEDLSDALNDAEFGLLSAQIARAYGCLLPRPHPLRHADRLGAAFEREVREVFQRLPDTEADTMEIIAALLDGPQHNLAALLIAETARLCHDAPRRQRPRADRVQVIFLLIRAAVAVLDRAIVR